MKTFIVRLNLILMVCSFFLFSCNNAESGKSTIGNMVSANLDSQKLLDNKALILNLYQALNDTNWTLARSLVDTGFKHHFVKDTGFGFVSWNGFEQGYRMSQNAFPDWKLTPLRMIAEGDYVSVLLNGKGTHLGEFAGISPTKIKAGTPIMLLHEIKNGKIAADWEIMNTDNFMKQLKKK